MGKAHASVPRIARHLDYVRNQILHILSSTLKIAPDEFSCLLRPAEASPPQCRYRRSHAIKLRTENGISSSKPECPLPRYSFEQGKPTAQFVEFQRSSNN